jgi:hypothetical protein
MTMDLLTGPNHQALFEYDDQKIHNHQGAQISICN